jgi:thioredoxin-related protein
MILKTVLTLLALLVSVLPVACADSPGDTKIRWMGYNAAREQKPALNKKMFIYFSSANCGYCRKLENEVFSRDEIADYINTHYAPVLIDIDRNRKTAVQFGIQGVPDLRFVSEKGEPIARWPGYIEAPHLLNMLKYIHTDSYLEMGFQEFTKKQ